MTEREPKFRPEDFKPRSFGEWNKMDQSRSMETPGGTIAWYTSPGIGYKDRNEDAIVIAPNVDGMAVIDGVGGHAGGVEAARILADNFQSSLGNVTRMIQAHENTTAQLASRPDMRQAAACYIAAYYDLQTHNLNITQAGDVRLVVLDHTGWAYFKTIDDHLPDKHHKVTNFVTGDEETTPTKTGTRVAAGDRIIIASDGLWDNYGIPDVAGMVQNLSAHEAVNTVSRALLDKMRRSDAGELNPDEQVKPDNLSIVIYDVKR